MVRHSVLRGFYEVERTIGCGGFAKVKLATHLATGEKVAIKIMNKNSLKDDLHRIRLELKALKTLSHKHICQLYEVIETETHFFIIVEYCSGGELFDHIVEKNRLSESESRIFLRQIISAVAYLHSLGYAHRDLKPENVLLDKDQSLKLIDFGLCARPEGGMKTPLQTSCGSPTYAAPELVLGKQYLGPEVDVWAMGVLLYALLCGFLPFDDQNIDSLYKKILSGKYFEPNFISKQSKSLIRSMLQVDPKNRITVQELLSHPWITLGVFEPVEVKSTDLKNQDDEIIALMAHYNEVSTTTMWKYLKKWKYDYHTSTYLLLLSRKRKGLPLKLNSPANKIPIRVQPRIKPQIQALDFNSPNNKLLIKSSGAVDSPKTPLTPSTVGSTYKKFDLENLEPTTPVTPKENFIEPKNVSTTRKPQKRIRSPNMDADCSPVPAKKFATPGRSTPKSTEKKKTPETPARRVLDTIGRSLHKVRNVLTPKKHGEHGEAGCQPSVLTNKDLCNVSTTEYTDPEFVITELIKALEKKDCHCVRKGFTIRGKIEPNVYHQFGGCSFELEICYIPSMYTEGVGTPSKSILKNGIMVNGVEVAKNGDIKITEKRVGIRRKRLKGNSWCYKKVCEQVLAFTTNELKHVAESSV